MTKENSDDPAAILAETEQMLSSFGIDDDDEDGLMDDIDVDAVLGTSTSGEEQEDGTKETADADITDDMDALLGSDPLSAAAAAASSTDNGDDDDDAFGAIDGFAIDSDGEDEEDAEVDGTGAKNPTAKEEEEAEKQEKMSSFLHPLADELLTTPPSPLEPSEAPVPPTATDGIGASAVPTPSVSSTSSTPSFASFASGLSSFAKTAASQIDKVTDKIAHQIPSIPSERGPVGSPMNIPQTPTGGFTTPAQTNTASVAGGIPPTTPGTAPPTTTTTTTASATPSFQQPSQELDNEQKVALVKIHLGELLPGERVIMFLGNLLHVTDSTNQYPVISQNGMWCCAMTYFRLALFHTSTLELKIQLPLASMDKVEKSIYQAGIGPTIIGNGSNGLVNGANPTTLMGLVIYGKDNGRQIRFTTPSYADTLRAHEALQTYAFPGRRNLGYLFAFESKRQLVMDSVTTTPDGKKVITLPPTRNRYVAEKEFTRQGFLDSGVTTYTPWTVWRQMNAQYQLCMSYPEILVGPASLDVATADGQRVVRQCAAFRSEQRLPALTWAEPRGGASIWRCSQPKVGLQGNRSSADEAFFRLIAESAATANTQVNAAAAATNQSHTVDPEYVQQLTGSLDKEWLNPDGLIKILDLRSKTSAMGNRTGGYGYENTSYYTGSTIQFCNIGNIHAVRDAYQKISALCLNPSSQDVQWMSLVENTNWLSMTRLILSAAWQTAFYVHVHKLPVVLHCSHGWDRTSQVAGIAELLIDPYYRTREGFSCLVEKDFMAFGHPFHTRCAHGEGRGDSGPSASKDSSTSSTNEGQISPIFIQFLDCVYQLVNQYPEMFEFNTKYLLLLSEHVYSCRFGTMLCDTEREREVVASIRQRTHCLWEFLDSREDLVNPQFVSNADAKLWMSQSSLLRNVSLWVDRFCMHSPKSTLRKLPNDLEYIERQQQRKIISSLTNGGGHDLNVLKTKEDFHRLSLMKAFQEVEKWKQIAKERQNELGQLKGKSKGEVVTGEATTAAAEVTDNKGDNNDYDSKREDADDTK